MSSREIDDVYNRITAKDSYKKRKFGNKKSIRDDYTGERIFYGNNKDSIYKHSMKKTADVDHITPIAVVNERYDDLTIEQRKKLANNEKYNYAITNSELNRNSRTGKNALENHEYLGKKIGQVIDTAKNGELNEVVDEVKDLSKQSGRMLVAEAKSRTGMTIEANIMRTENKVKKVKCNMQQVNRITCDAKENFVLGAKQSIEDSVIPLTAEAVHHLCYVVNGDEELGETANNMMKEIIKTAVVGGSKQLYMDASSVLLKNNKSGIFQKFVSKNQINQIIKVALIVKESAMQYINGEINGNEFIEQVGEKGKVMVAGMIGGEVGKEIGAIIGGIVGTGVLPGIGTVGGIIAGKAIGDILGTIITTVACSAIVSVISTTKHLNDYKLKDSEIRRIEAEALNEMSNQRDKLRNIFEQEYRYWDTEIQDGFDMILSSTCQQSYNLQGITEGLDKILSIFGKNVAFKSLDEYEAQLESTLVLNFGRR